MPNIIQYYRGEIPETHLAAKQTILDKKPNEYGYILETKLPEYILKTDNQITIESDLFRLDWLLKNPNDIWMDLDVSCDKWFDFVDNGKPWFCHDWGYPNTWIIAPMGNVDLLRLLLQIVVPENVVPANPWCYWINQNKDKVNLIPNGYFRHKQFNYKPRTEEAKNDK